MYVFHAELQIYIPDYTFCLKKQSNLKLKGHNSDLLKLKPYIYMQNINAIWPLFNEKWP